MNSKNITKKLLALLMMGSVSIVSSMEETGQPRFSDDLFTAPAINNIQDDKQASNKSQSEPIDRRSLERQRSCIGSIKEAIETGLAQEKSEKSFQKVLSDPKVKRHLAECTICFNGDTKKVLEEVEKELNQEGKEAPAMRVGMHIAQQYTNAKTIEQIDKSIKDTIALFYINEVREFKHSGSAVLDGMGNLDVIDENYKAFLAREIPVDMSTKITLEQAIHNHARNFNDSPRALMSYVSQYANSGCATDVAFDVAFIRTIEKNTPDRK